MSKVAAILMAVVLASALAFAELRTVNNISASSTSQTILIGRLDIPSFDVAIVNDSTSTNELYFRLFVCGESVGAATTSNVRLQPGESRNYRWVESAGGPGYCAISIVCASAETATARVEWQ